MEGTFGTVRLSGEDLKRDESEGEWQYIPSSAAVSAVCLALRSWLLLPLVGVNQSFKARCGLSGGRLMVRPGAV